MSDSITPLDGEDIIPTIAAPKAQGNRNRMFVAAAILIVLVLIVGVILWKVAHRMFHSDDGVGKASAGVVAQPAALRLPPPSSTDSIASAPEATGSTAASAPASGASVPSLAVASKEGEAIPVRGASGQSAAGTAGAGAHRKNPDDAPIFPADTAPDIRGRNTVGDGEGHAQGSAAASMFTAPPRTGNAVTDAKAALAAYKAQLGEMMDSLQRRVGNDPAGQQALKAGLAAAGAAPAAGTGVGAPRATPTQFSGSQGGSQASPAGGGTALFGSMEKSSTPRVQASMLGDRSMILPMGAPIQCDLKTRVVTATSGMVGCNLIRNVYSENGRVVLLERGTHLDGEYRIVQVRPGTTRIPVLWTRARTPNGVVVPLDSPATGELGESGMGGYVDNRWGERLGAALMLSLIQDAIQYQTAKDTSDTSSGQVVFPNTASQGSKMADQVLSATINIPPLLYQNQGSIVGVYVARDVDFSSVYELQPQ